MIPGFWGFLKQGGILQGYPFSSNVYYVGSGSPVFGKRVDSITSALRGMIPKDILFLGPGSYDEGNLTIETPDITIIGAGNRGEIGIAPQTTGQNGVNILADGVQFVNVGVSSSPSGTYAVKVGNAALQIDRVRLYGCKLEGDGINLWLQQAGDLLVEDGEFCWGDKGIQLQSGNEGFCTQIFVSKCRFHNLTTFHIGQAAAAQQVDNLQVSDCIHDNAEDGTAPTDYILLEDNANTGIFTRNSFATATNATGVLTIGTGLKWVANATEAGWSTARPA